MVISEIKNIKIAGIAGAVSNKWTSLESLDTEDEKVIKKFIKKTGVEGRYEAGWKQTTSDFCFVAARELLKAKNVDPSEIGAVVFVTQTSDYYLPATACVLQERLGISRDCLAFDVNLGCSGYSSGLNIIASIMDSSNINKALLLAGDTSGREKSKYGDKHKVTHAAGMLFGDAGTATLLEKDDNAKPITMVSKTDGAGFKAIISPFGGWRNPVAPGKAFGSRMDDIAVFNFTISEVPELLNETMNINGFSTVDYDCLVLHQANLYILKQIAKRTGFEMEKMKLSLDEFANTSSASIPITFVKQYGDTDQDHEIHSLMCGFGVGLSWSTIDAFVNVNDILPVIHTDEYFEDGYAEEIKTFIDFQEEWNLNEELKDNK